MSAIRLAYLVCDTPDCESTTSDGMHETVADARHFAQQQQGWKRRGNLDICPWCAAGHGPYEYGDEHVRELPGSDS